MKYILTIVALFCIVSSNAQETGTANKPPRRKAFQISASFSPGMAYRTLKVQEELNALENLKTDRDERETPRFAYQCGLRIGYYITKNIGIETGVLYARKGYSSKWQEGETYDVEKWRYTHNLEYIDFPLLINLRSNHTKVRFIANLGLVFNHLLRENNKYMVVYRDESTNKITEESYEDFNRFNLVGTFGFGLDIPIASRFGFQVKPNFRYGFLKIVDAPLTGYLWDAGLELRFYVEI